MRVSHREARGNCFIPFHFREAAANLLTIDEIDPVGKIPEFKFCAVRIEPRRPKTRRCAEAQRRRVPGVEARAGKFPGPSLIPALNAIQERVGWLPREELVTLSRDVRRPLYEIEGLISFYPHFRTDAAGEGRAARLPRPVLLAAAARTERIAELRDRYGRDADVEVTEVSCIGRCDVGTRGRRQRAPGGRWRTCADAAARSTAEPPQPDGIAGPRQRRRRPAVASGRDARRWPNDPYASAAGDATAVAARRAVPVACDAGRGHRRAEGRGLRGMGGAGFPTGRKWELVAAQAATPKYAICNADESEPGTFKDRQILAEQPHLVLEGLLLGMVAVGAEEGWVFIRHEYGPEEAVIRREIEWLRHDGLIGPGWQARMGAAPAGDCRSRCSPRRAATSSARSRR